MQLILNDELSQLKGFVPFLNVEKDGDGMHEHHPQQAIAQMPQVASPAPFGSATIDELAEDGVNAIAHPAQHRTPTMGRGMLSRAERRDQDNAQLLQARLEVGQSIVAVTQQQAAGGFAQIENHIAVMHIG